MAWLASDPPAAAAVGVSMCQSTMYKVTCALFFDIEDGQEFGALIVREMLQEFLAVSG